MVSYSVAQRTREVGIRLALGARRAVAIRPVIGDTAVAVLVGASAGLAGGVYASRFVRALVYEVTAGSASSLLLPVGLLLAVVLLAALVPARRAALVDPMVALRTE